MSKDLNDKLNRIIAEVWSDGHYNCCETDYCESYIDGNDEAIEAIHDAFKSAGYVKRFGDPVPLDPTKITAWPGVIQKTCTKAHHIITKPSGCECGWIREKDE